MIIHWSEYTHGGNGQDGNGPGENGPGENGHGGDEAARQCALQGETASGHCFHICAKSADETVELWAESAGALDYVGDFPSETAAKIHAERLAASG